MMLVDNPFYPATDFLPAHFMQAYIVLMAVAVAAGTLFDLYHKRSAEFFMQQRRRSRMAATRQPGTMEMVRIAACTLVNEVASSGEFCNPQRRVSHVLMSYGFVLYLVTTILLIFAYPADPHPPAMLPLLWNLGAVMVLVGGFWFFFFLRVDVAYESRPRWRLVRADLFIVSLLASVSFALVWETLQMTGDLRASQAAFVLYLFFTTLLCVGVPWSKFAHMFYKPAAAFQKRVEEANGSSTLPRPTGGKRCPLSRT